MRLIATRKRHQNSAVLDPWTTVHFSSGLALGLMDAPEESSLAAAIGYEVAEQFVERQAWGEDLFRTHGPEIVLNAVMDAAVFSLGHWLGKACNQNAEKHWHRFLARQTHSVPIVLGLIRTLAGNPDILGLRLREIGEPYAQFLEVESGHLLVQMLP